MIKLISINIICPGNWNKKIFTPIWVYTKLFEIEIDTIKTVDAIVNPVEMEFGYKHKDVLLFPKDNVLEIKLDKINDESRAFSGFLLNKILHLLPYTPLKAIGINVRYSFNKTENYQIVKTLNRLNCKLNDFSTNQIKFSKRFDDYQLNIITNISDKNYIVNFNYYYPKVVKFNDDIINTKIANSKSIIKNE